MGRSEKRAGEFALPPGTLLFPDKGEDFAKPRDAHAVTRTFVRHAKKLGFEMRFHDITASHLTILPDNGVAIPTVNARNTPIRANIVGPPRSQPGSRLPWPPAIPALRALPSEAS